MVVKKTLSSITRGADLLKPRLDFQYVVAAMVGVTVLLVVYKGAQMAFDRLSLMGQSRNPMAPKPDYKAALGIV